VVGRMKRAATQESRSLDLPRARVLLDGALVGLRGVKDSEVPLRAVERHLVASLGALYRALARVGEADFHDFAVIARNRARAALASLQSARSREPEVQQLIRDVREVVDGWELAMQRTVLEPLRLPRPASNSFPRAQGEVPTLVELAREPLMPAIVLPWEEAPDTEEPAPAPEGVEPATIEELDALLAQAAQGGGAPGAPAKKKKEKPASAPEKKAKPPVDQEEVERAQLGETLSREAVELARARAFFEDVAMMSVMRQPDEGDVWSELRPVEERLLARVDGILACGPWVLPELVKLLDERPVPDPEMTWGVLFLHGCLAGTDALHQVERLVRTAGLDVPEVFDAASDTLTFVPHPGVEGLLRGWLRPGDAVLRRLAARVLGRRGVLDGREALELTWSDVPELVLEGARALPLTRGELDLRETARLLRHPDEEVVACAIEALLLRRSAAGLQHALGLLADGRGAFAGAAQWAAIGGGPEALADFETATKGKLPPAVLEAMGWYGNLKFVDLLLARLAKGEVAAVGALQRLTGASLTKDEPDPEYAKGDEPFVRGFAPPPVELELTEDAEVWSAWWAKHRGRASLTKRYRWGHLWSPQDNLWELEHAPASMRERRLAYHELVARTGATHPFDPREFVSRQQAALARWREAPELRKATAGTWTLSLSR